MKTKLLITCGLTAIVYLNSFSQIGIGTVDVEQSAILEIESSTKGFLLPRMTTLEKHNIDNPAEGLMVYSTNSCETGTISTFYNGKWNNLPDCSDTDFDDDGIPNAIDLDADNDGIPNVLESTPQSINFNYTYSNGDVIGVDNVITLNVNNLISVQFDLRQVDNSCTFSINGTSLTAQRAEFEALHYTSNNEVTVKYDNSLASDGFNAPWKAGLSLDEPRYRLFVSNQGTVKLFAEQVAKNQNLEEVFTYSGSLAANQTLAPFNTVTYLQGNNTIQFELGIESGTSAINGRIVGYSSLDSDNDNIPNHLDLDSDNDGCPDSYEAGATTDVNEHYIRSTVGTNGMANSLETNDSQNSGINYTIDYSKAIDGSCI